LDDIQAVSAQIAALNRALKIKTTKVNPPSRPA